jgi:hypothetical protein
VQKVAPFLIKKFRVVGCIGDIKWYRLEIRSLPDYIGLGQLEIELLHEMPFALEVVALQNQIYDMSLFSHYSPETTYHLCINHMNSLIMCI